MGDDFSREDHVAGVEQFRRSDAAATHNSVVVPVTRDARFAHFRPDRLSIVHISANQSDKYELRLQSFLYHEKSQRIDLAPGSDLGVIGREVCMEVLELGTIDLTPQQMVKLRDDLSREIGSAVAALPPALPPPGFETEPDAPPVTKRPDSPAALATSAQTASKPHPLFDGTSREPVPRRQTGMGLSSAAAALAVLLVTALAGSVVWFAGPISSRVSPSGGSAAPGAHPAAAPLAAPGSAAPAHADPEPAPDTASAPAALPSDVPRSAGPPPADTQPAASVQGAAAPSAAGPGPAVDTPTAPEPGPAAPGQAQAAAPASDSAPAAAPSNATAAAPGDAPVASGPVPHLAVIVRASCWIIVSDASGKVVVEKLLKPGESWTAPALPGLQLRTGNAGATSLVIDGAVGAPLGADNAIWTGPLEG